MHLQRFEDEIHPPLNPGFSPIVGNDHCGGFVHHEPSGKALYAVYAESPVKGISLFRTKGQWKDLLTSDDSVEFVASIYPGDWVAGRGFEMRPMAYPQYIDGILYCHISGKVLGTNRLGAWIYRDTSEARDGSGPWVEHGTVVQHIFPVRVEGDYDHFSGLHGGGEILVLPDGRWLVADMSRPGPYGGEGYVSKYTMARTGAHMSHDGGVTWTETLDRGWYAIGGVYGYSVNRNWAKLDGKWWWSASGNTSAGVIRGYDGNSWGPEIRIGENGDGAYFMLSVEHPISKAWFWANPGTHLPYNGIYETTAPLTTTVLPDEKWVPALIGEWSQFGFNGVSGSHSWPVPVLCRVSPPRSSETEDDDDPWFALHNLGRVIGLKMGDTRVRQYPRDDGHRMSSASRIYPPPKAQRIFGNIQ